MSLDPNGSRNARLASIDQQHVWHPFTQMQEWSESEPLVIERAEGNHLIDSHGNRYLDGVASLWVNVHGHNRPEINQAIARQLERVAHSTLLGLSNVPSIELAERLAQLAPGGLSRVFYSDNGSTAVEIALKQAHQYWQLRGRPEKHRFVHLAESYHGDTLGAVGVGGIGLFHEIFGKLVVKGITAPTPHLYRHPDASTPEELTAHCLGALEALFDAHADEIAAFIVEPLVQGAGGILVHPPDYLRGAAALCREHDVLLIADEVATGFGRTGTMFACEQEDVVPDFLCLAKGITGGYLPLAATLTTEAIYEAFLAPRAEFKAFFHGHSFTGNPLACAAGLASLDLFETDQTLAKLPAKVDLLAQRLDQEVADLPWVRDVRQRGLMVGVELVADRDGARPYPVDTFIGARVCARMRHNGVITRPLGDVVVLMPPLSIEPAEIEHLVSALASALQDECALASASRAGVTGR